jgi:hypothetical protein
MSGCIFFHDHPADHAPVQTRNVFPEVCAMADGAIATTAVLAAAAFNKSRRFTAFPPCNEFSLIVVQP